MKDQKPRKENKTITYLTCNWNIVKIDVKKTDKEMMDGGKIERKLEKKTILFEIKFLQQQQNQFQISNLFFFLPFSELFFFSRLSLVLRCGHGLFI